MPAGRMRSFLTVERQSKVSDGGGGYVVTWVEVASVPAQLRPLKPSSAAVEGMAGGSRSSMPAIEVTVRPDDSFGDLLANPAAFRLRDPETDATWGVNAAQDYRQRGMEITITATRGEPT